MKGIIAAVALLLLVSMPTYACQFNTDCGVGSKCIKKSGKLEGICVGGMDPGNDSDRKPYRDPLDISGKVGNTCSFNTDCGVGNVCVKESGRLNGVCMKR